MYAHKIKLVFMQETTFSHAHIQIYEPVHH